MRSTCSPSKNNVLLVTCFRKKLLFSSCRRCFDRSSSIFTSSKCNKGRNGLFNGSLFGACYHSKRHKAIVAKDLANCWYVNTLIVRVGIPRRVPSLKEESLVVIPRSFDNGGMIEIHVRYQRRHSSEIVKLRPITKARQTCIQTKARQMQSK